MPIKIFTALLVQDVQNDFMKDGAMPVAGAEAVLEPISKIAATFSRVIALRSSDRKIMFFSLLHMKGKSPVMKLKSMVKSWF